MPPQNRVGRDDRGDFAQAPPTQTVAASRQPTPVRIGQPEASSAQLSSKDPVFFNQIGHGLLPLLAPPTRQGQQQEPKGGDVHHGWSLYDRSSVQIKRRRRKRSIAMHA
jgi:hypothetical protein